MKMGNFLPARRLLKGGEKKNDSHGYDKGKLKQKNETVLYFATLPTYVDTLNLTDVNDVGLVQIALVARALTQS